MPEDVLDRSRITPAMRSILVDHLNIATVLNQLRELALEPREDESAPDFTQLFFILTYVERYSDAVHHPKEERFLFPALLRRAPAAAGQIERLYDEHREGNEQLGSLRAALEAYQRDASARAGFEAEAAACIERKVAHMAREEGELLPLAQAALTASDWVRLHEDFQHADPLFERPRQHEFEILFRAITGEIGSEDDSAPPHSAAG